MAKIYQILPTKNISKFLAKQEHVLQTRLIEAMEQLQFFPPDGDIKRMQGKRKGWLRLRVGKYRIIFRVDIANEVVHIDEIDSRGDIY